MTQVLGIAGWSGSGKTTLVVALIPRLVAHGVSVSTIKHAHHNFEIDEPGKDSYRHRKAGATEVLVGASSRWALIHELRDEPEPKLDDLLAKLSDVDLVLVEGFKKGKHPKIEVVREGGPQSRLYRDDPAIIAVVSDRPVEDANCPVLPLDDIHAIVDFIVQELGLLDGQPDSKANG